MQKMKSNNHILSVIDEGDFEKKLVEEVKKDFERRQFERRSFESQWQLNMNFLMGNQYCSIGSSGDIEEFEKQFFWQEREVYNQIAPIVEIRLAKLQRVRPSMAIAPASNDERDLKTAKLSKKIVSSVYSKALVSSKINEATRWSEICGTSFYKVIWNNNMGTELGNTNKKVGDVEIDVLSPFEIYPESSNCERLEDNRSIIHAKAYHVDVIKNIWGVDVEGEEVNVFTLDSTNKTIYGLDYNGYTNKIMKTTRENHAIVIEKYELPSLEFPNGRLIIVAGDKLLHVDELPFKNGVDGERGYPFIRQVSCENLGCFWGNSVIDRIIPVQRAYNTIKNRKHEYINRLSMGILTVEDGSVDVDNLEEDGLSPGKVLVYRQGSQAPRYMSNTSVPLDFAYEEDKLLNEIMLISGVSDLIRDQSAFSSNISGVALQLLIEQDETRLSTTAEQIRDAIKALAQHILRLYKQFAGAPRLCKVVGDNGDIEVFYFNSSDITSDDVIFETQNDITETLAQRRTMVFDLLNAGLLYDENGKLSNRMRVKALDLLGFGIWENSQDLNELHTKKASSENLAFLEGKKLEVLEIDAHDLHIAEHIAFMLSKEFEEKADKNMKEKMLEHIRTHKKMRKIEQDLEQKGE